MCPPPPPARAWHGRAANTESARHKVLSLESQHEAAGTDISCLILWRERDFPIRTKGGDKAWKHFPENYHVSINRMSPASWGRRRPRRLPAEPSTPMPAWGSGLLRREAELKQEEETGQDCSFFLHASSTDAELHLDLLLTSSPSGLKILPLQRGVTERLPPWVPRPSPTMPCSPLHLTTATGNCRSFIYSSFICPPPYIRAEALPVIQLSL